MHICAYEKILMANFSNSTIYVGGGGVVFLNIKLEVPSIWGNYAQKWGLAGRPEKGNFTVIQFSHANHPGHIK